MEKKFIIVDGSSLLHRAFYALPPFTSSKGVNTGAVYGLANMLLKIVKEEKPDYMAVAFDKSRKTFRTDIYSEYKAHRKETPHELSEQFPIAIHLVEAFGIKALQADDYEADDIIGTLSVKARIHNINSIIVTGDKDALQLINDSTVVFLTKKGISEIKLFDEVALKEEYGLEPSQIVDLKALMGDASDNIPGIPGVGEKTANKLLAEYGTVENLLENAGKVKGKLGEKIAAGKDIALLSKKLATIDTYMDIPFEPRTFTITPDRDMMENILSELELRNIKDKVEVLFSAKEAALDDSQQADALEEMSMVFSAEHARELLCTEHDNVFFHSYVLGELPDITLDAVEALLQGKPYLFRYSHQSWDILEKWLSMKNVSKVGCDVKSFYQACKNSGINIDGLLDDCAIAAYLCDPSINNYNMTNLAEKFGVRSKGLSQSALLKNLFEKLMQNLEENRQEELYKSLELPLVRVLADMELNGIKVDKDELEKMSKELAEKIDVLQKDITQMAGEEFNINSPKQLGVVLFERLALPVQKKTKTGYSTDAEVLENLSGLHPIVDAILEYRFLSKLQSTYLEGMKPLINEKTGRVYTHFQQLVTNTGRLSSTAPNLQNIPVRTETGKRIREFFVPGESFDWIMSFDYSQVELRILAHISEDPLFTEAFLHGEDIHKRTAAEVFGMPLEEVTSVMRNRAKAVNFGIVYGISDYGLARDLGISRTEAGEYIKNYLARYQGIQAFMKNTIDDARKKGYVTTLFNRRRYLPDINSSNFNSRSFAERTAINTPIQGTAADIIKKAMVDVAAVLKGRNLKSRLLLQVHDELVFEVPDDEVAVMNELITDTMQKTVALKVPLIVDAAKGKNWAQTK